MCGASSAIAYRKDFFFQYVKERCCFFFILFNQIYNPIACI